MNDSVTHMVIHKESLSSLKKKDEARVAMANGHKQIKSNDEYEMR